MKIRVTIWPDDLNFADRLQYDYMVGPFELPIICPVNELSHPADLIETQRAFRVREAAIDCIQKDIAHALVDALDKRDHRPYGRDVGLPAPSTAVRPLDTEKSQ